MFIIKYKTFFISLSAALVVASLCAVAFLGLPLGIDFKGGSALEISFSGVRPDVATVVASAAKAGFIDVTVQPVGAQNFTLKHSVLSEDQRAALLDAVTEHGKTGVQAGFTTIGPSVGAELKHKAILSVIFVLVAIILFVAYAFRSVSKPVSSWKYGLAVIIALAHDIAIPLGAFALLARFTGAELDTLFIVALLTTLALSVSDTIVVFDRIREHLKNDGKKPFDVVVGESLSQTLGRSINTSFVVLVMVVTLAIVGPESTRLFATVLAIGMFFGTYSSIFLASPLLVVMNRKNGSKK